MPIDLRVLKRFLIALLAVVSVVVTIDQVSLVMRLKRVHEAGSTVVLQDRVAQRKKDLEPLEVFQEALLKRNLFDVTEAHSGAAERKSSIAELAKDYRLKGVALFTAPEGILEDARTGSTVFVRKGEKLGELTVKEIKQDSLILSYEGQDHEIKIQGGI